MQTLAEFLARHIYVAEARLQEAIRKGDVDGERVQRLRLEMLESVAKELLGDSNADDSEEDDWTQRRR